MIKIIDEKSCCGCAACFAACPKHCIRMSEGSLGHLFPVVDENICINCKKCEATCPMNNFRNGCESREAYAAHSINPAIRFNGSSGGIFQTFAQKLMLDGYSVYGAAFDEELKLKCTEANDEDSLHKLTKSKYIQSDFSAKYEEISQKLKKGDKVFVTSTPCQIAALKAYLKGSYDNLITVDFFCHGVPSQRFFYECLATDEKLKYDGKVLAYSFRTKKNNGATPHYYTVTYERNGNINSITDYYFNSTFYAFFQKYLCLRESCYNCIFATRVRFSDITIGDFHDIDKYIDGINRFDGVSRVIINTPKGKALFDNCMNDLKVYSLDIEKLIADGTCFEGGTARPKERDEFVKDYQNQSIEALANKWVASNRYTKMRIYYSLPKMVRSIVKKYLGD